MPYFRPGCPNRQPLRSQFGIPAPWHRGGSGILDEVEQAAPPAREWRTETLYLNWPIRSESSGERDGMTETTFVKACQSLPRYLDELRVIIDSEGGHCSAAFDMALALEQTMAKHITTVCVGRAYSAAGVIFACGDERLMAVNGSKVSALMLHPAHIDGDCNAPSARQWTSDIATLLANRSGISWDQITEWMDQESYLDAHAAVACGLATGYDWGATLRTVPNLRTANRPHVRERIRG